MEAVEAVCRRLLRTGGTEEKLNQVCKPIEEGGVGLKEVLAWNKASLAKWLFELDGPQYSSIWKKWICKYRCGGGSIWNLDTIPSSGGKT